MATIPDWADAQLSKDLQVLRSQGENQDLEYMQSFPSNVKDLGKEIAAFASSNGGMIVIGVSDAGELIGLQDGQTFEGRDQLLRRVEGICRGTIKPAITPTARFALEDGKVALVISVPRGSQPIYYSSHIPYIRHLSSSRPAEPHEVVEIVTTWLGSTGSDPEGDPTSALFSQLARVLIEILIYGEEAKQREVNPWLDSWRSQYAYLAGELRSLAVDSIAIDKKMDADLNELAQALDEVASMRMTMGVGPTLSDLVKKAVELAKKTKSQWIDGIPLSAQSLDEIAKALSSNCRKLCGLAARADQMMDRGQFDEFQAEASLIGHTILRFGYYDLSSLQDGFNEEVRNIGRRLHLIETHRIYADGGQSIDKIVAAVSEGCVALEALLDGLKYA